MSELDELLSIALGHGVVRIASVGTLVDEEAQTWSVSLTASNNVVAVGRGRRLEEALRCALRTLDGAT